MDSTNVDLSHIGKQQRNHPNAYKYFLSGDDLELIRERLKKMPHINEMEYEFHTYNGNYYHLGTGYQNIGGRDGWGREIKEGSRGPFLSDSERISMKWRAYDITDEEPDESDIEGRGRNTPTGETKAGDTE